jgi:GNAT superfamily N-acetyltransferase
LLLLQKIDPTDRDAIIQHTITEFHGNGISDAEIAYFTKNFTDWDLSRKLTLDAELIGFYLLHEDSINSLLSRYDHYKPLEDLSGYATKRGVEGVILLVLPQYRGKGYGNLLKDLPRSMGYQYVYGEQFKATPDVLQHWLKRRRLIADCCGPYGDVWVTLEDLN